MMIRTNLLGYTPQQLEALLVALGDQPYKGRQVFKWLYKSRQYDFEQMTDLTKERRVQLAELYEFKGLDLVHEQLSEDGTRKFLFQLADGSPLETVLIPDEDKRRTVCVSSQVGCALACRFCATGTMGLGRDLSPGEIVAQLLYLRDRFGDDAFTNIVFMGMGEPLLNYDNVVAACRLLIHPDGMAISARKITISTSGITPKIRKLADCGLKVRLALSLHAASQEKRRRIMPVADTFKLDKLMEAVRYFAETTGNRVTLEYILFKGFNDTKDDVLALSRLVEGIPCKINLLAYNPVDGLNFERPSDEQVDWFGRELFPRAPAVTVRKSRGRDIDAACGQLAARQRLRRPIHA